MIKHLSIHRATEGKFYLVSQDEKLRIPHRGEGVSWEYTGNILEQHAESRRGGVGERGARPSRGVERCGLVLGRD